LKLFNPISCHGPPLGGLEITLTGHNTLGRTPLDGWSARRRDLNLTAHNTHKRETNIYAPCGIFIRTLFADPRLTPRGHWDRADVLIEI